MTRTYHKKQLLNSDFKKYDQSHHMATKPEIACKY